MIRLLVIDCSFCNFYKHVGTQKHIIYTSNLGGHKCFDFVYLDGMHRQGISRMWSCVNDEASYQQILSNAGATGAWAGVGG